VGSKVRHIPLAGSFCVSFALARPWLIKASKAVLGGGGCFAALDASPSSN